MMFLSHQIFISPKNPRRESAFKSEEKLIRKFLNSNEKLSAVRCLGWCRNYVLATDLALQALVCLVEYHPRDMFSKFANEQDELPKDLQKVAVSSRQLNP